MRFEIRGSDFPLTAAIVEHTHQRLSRSLSRNTERIKRVVVRLGDTNGPRGGEDKFCRLQIDLRDSPPVLIHDVGVDLYSVITRVTSRAGKGVAKRASRLKTRLRQRKKLSRRQNSESAPVDGSELGLSD